MTATTVDLLRDALETKLKTVSGINVYARTKSNVNTPCATVTRTGTSFHEVSMGTVEWRFRVTVYVALTSDKGAQESLDRFLNPDDPLSVKKALESDRTLGGVAEDVTVTEVGEDQVYERVAGTVAAQYLGTEFTVQVHAPGR